MTARFSSQLPPEGCNEQVGFLFKRRCGRQTRVGCPHCDRDNRSTSSDRYYSDYESYSASSDSSTPTWMDSSGGDTASCPDGFSNDFTEADADAFTDDGCPSDFDYENDMGAS